MRFKSMTCNTGKVVKQASKQAIKPAASWSREYQLVSPVLAWWVVSRAQGAFLERPRNFLGRKAIFT